MLLRTFISAGALLAASFAPAFVSAATAPATTTVHVAYDLPDLSPNPATPIVFVDAMAQSAPWTANVQLKLDARGNVTALPSGAIADALVYAPGQAYGTGDYTLTYSGSGTVDVTGATLIGRSNGRAIVRVLDPRQGLHVRLLATNPSDYVRGVHLFLPGTGPESVTHPFTAAFVESLGRFGTLRFTHWMRAATNTGSMIWPDRSNTVGAATQAGPSGVAPEFAIALANATGADPWILLPVGATNAYVRGVADLVHRTLDGRLHPVFQYGDDPWRTGSATNAYAAMAGSNFHLGNNPQAEALNWYGLRSRQVCAIVHSTFGHDAKRTVCAISGPQHDVIGVDALALPLSAVTPEALAEAARVANAAGAALYAYGNAKAGAAGTSPRFSPSLDAARVPAATDLVLEGHGERKPHPLHRPVALHISRPSFRLPTVGIEGALGFPLESVDVSDEGLQDWQLANGERKAGGNGLIVSTLGAAGPAISLPNSTQFDWTNGRRSATGKTLTGAYLAGGRGLRITAPADGVTRILRVYVGVRNARGVLHAYLGHNQGAFSNTALVAGNQLYEGVYTLVYRAPARTTLTVEYSAQNGTGAIFRAATLAPYGAAGAATPSDVAIYHNDLRRSGWDRHEQVLTQSNVSPSTFGLQQTLTVDDNVLAQPQYVAQYAVPGKGTHNLLIVATENDSVYEFDADTGAIVNQVSLGQSQDSGDVGCGDIRPHYGISGTPAIDRASGTIYVVAATEPTSFSFHTMIHALDIGTLADKRSPVELTASANLSNGSKVTFSAQNQMNRTSLAFTNGTLYVGIGSHCDNDSQAISGWLLRYSRSLRQIAAFHTIEDPENDELSSIWMSGFAPAFDATGNPFLVTGNGAFDANTGGLNFGESVLKLTPDLSSVTSYFTPKEFQQLNQEDADFGAGGTMLLPPLQATQKFVAVAMGKTSKLYLLNRFALGGWSTDDHGALQVYQDSGEGVWGGPAFYNGPSGLLVYYQTGGDVLRAFTVTQGSGGKPQIQPVAAGNSDAGYGGSLPIVSSHAQMPGTGIVWLVNRTSPLTLEAYDADDISHLLFAGPAGTWQNPQQNGFVSPLVANGRVYVPATGTISVFGLLGTR